MQLLSRIAQSVLTPRHKEIEHFMRHPVKIQSKQLQLLTDSGRKTLFGQNHNFEAIGSYEDFIHEIPVTDYDRLTDYIERSRMGESDILWPGTIRWFAKSSGTTGAKSKYIPVSRYGLDNCHMQGPKDVMALLLRNYPDTKVLSGKTLTLGGSRKLEPSHEATFEGDLSAILIDNTPFWAAMRRIPKVETALIADFEEKVRRICEETTGQDVTSFAGVPSWNLVMMNKILEYTGKQNLLEVWPSLELFVHGGMNFKPYHEQYKRLIPSSDMKYMETYNASEGFFAIQDDPQSDDMLLMLDYGVFYEFMPMCAFGDPSQIVPLEGVQQGVNYALIITTCNGLWRYMIGDTVEFTALDPYKIKITGRTKHYINAFGEEVIMDNAEKALRAACAETRAEVAEYTAGPIYMQDKTKGSHQWIVEFNRYPDDIEVFTDALDRALQGVNSDYEAKRFKNTTLLRPTVTVVPAGHFYRWMKLRGKAGGQNKIPRLYNDRTYIDELLKLL